MHSLDRKVVENCIHYSFSKSSGKGGQHANKVETRVTACFNICNLDIPVLLRDRIIKRLNNKLSSKGEICVSIETYRSQAKNKELAKIQLIQTILEASKIPKARLKTRPTINSKKKRLEMKKKHSEKKQNRRFRNF